MLFVGVLNERADVPGCIVAIAINGRAVPRLSPKLRDFHNLRITRHRWLDNRRAGLSSLSSAPKAHRGGGTDRSTPARVKYVTHDAPRLPRSMERSSVAIACIVASDSSARGYPRAIEAS